MVDVVDSEQIEHVEWCTAHDGQNFIKLVFMSKNENKKYYMAPKETVMERV